MRDKSRPDAQPAFVLHGYPFRETSLIVEAFTREHGRLGLVARGARRPKSSLRGVLLPFQPLLLSWSGQRELRTLVRAEWVGGYTPLARAAEGRSVELCRLLLDGGARLTVDWNERARSILEQTRYHENADVMRVLLDAGAPLPGREVCQALADVARRSGEDDLVQRLLPEE